MGATYPIENIAPVDRAEYWAQSLMNICGGFDTFSKDWSNFTGNIERRNIGGFDVAGISVNADRISRSRKQITQNDDRYCFLILQMQGRAVLSQRKNEAFLEPGDMAFIDSGYPSEFLYDGFMQQISLHIPRDTLESCLPNRQIEEAKTISGTSGMGAIIRDFLTSTYNQSAALEKNNNDIVRDSLLHFLSATLRGDTVEGALDIKVRQLSHIRKIIEENLGDPCLSPAMVAQLSHISTRHLHRLFKADGVSFGEWVRRRRLSEARRQLANLRFSDHTIISIAFNWGFNDAAHFSRSFRQEFGMSPRQYRLTK